MITQEIQYVMLNAHGRPVTKSHQDDEETIITGRTIQELLEHVAERVFDYGNLEYFLSEFDEGGECAGWTVVKQEITQTPISREDWPRS